MSDYPVLTHKMRTAEKDYIGDNCEIFLPFIEGSDDDYVDLANGVAFTKAGSIFTTPNAIINALDNADRIDSYSVKTYAGKHLLSFYAAKVGAGGAGFLRFSVGEVDEDFYLLLAGANTSIDSQLSAAVQCAMGAIVANDIVLIAATFNADTGELRTYNGINGAVAFANTADASVHKDALGASGLSVDVNITIPSGMMGAGFLNLDALPEEDDLIDMLEVTRKNLISGKKYYDPRLSNY